jgi:hypothetical protein
LLRALPSEQDGWGQRFYRWLRTQGSPARIWKKAEGRNAFLENVSKL